MIFDTHLHTAVSPDSEMCPEEAIATLASMGYGCIFTEHVDYNPQGEPFFSVDFDVYPSDYIRFKSDTVGVGIEVSLIPECSHLIRAHAENPVYDYVLGAIHWIDGWDIAYAEDYFDEIGEGVYERYLDYSLKMIETHEFIDAFAHIDYISRYSPLAEKDLLYEKYADRYDALLRALIERDKPLEFNTRRMADAVARSNLFTIFSRYRELGGRFTTLGSDAHKSGVLGYMFNEALQMIDNIGLTPVYFKERRKIQCTRISN